MILPHCRPSARIFSMARTKTFNSRSPAVPSGMLSQSLHEFVSIDDCPFNNGVYAFVDGRTVLYIGHTTNFKARIATHRREKKWITPTTKVIVTPIADLDSRLHLETILMLAYRPLHNKLINIRFRADGTIYETPWLTPSYQRKKKKSSTK